MSAQPGGAFGTRGASQSRSVPFSQDSAAPAKSDTGSVYSWPFLVVLTYFLVDYGRPQDLIPGVAALRPGFLVLLSGVLALVTKQTFPKHALVRYMLAFLGLLCLLVPMAVHRKMAYDTTWAFAFLLLGGILPIVAFVDTFARLQTVIRFWVWIHVPLALYCITHTNAGVEGTGLGSFLFDENDFALALNMVLPYALALFMVERGTLRRLMMLGVSCVFLYAITTTLSRGGFLGLLCVGAFIWLRSDRKRLSLAVVAMFVVVVFALTPSSYWEEMKTIESAAEEGDTGYNRIYFWGIAWKVFLDNPVIGVGPLNFGYHAPQYESVREKLQGRHVYGKVAHSLYFTLLPEVGAVGTALFMAMLWRGWRERKHLRQRSEVALGRADLTHDEMVRARWIRQLTACIDMSLIGFLSTGAFISVVYYPHVWVLTALTAATLQVGTAAIGGLDTSPKSVSRPSWSAARLQR